MFAADSVGLIHSYLRDGLQKRMYFETECVMAVQGHPMSLISVPIESAYATYFLVPIGHQYIGPWSSFSPFQRYCRVLRKTATPPLFHRNFGDVLHFYLDLGLPDIPYFTGAPVFQPQSPASRNEATREIKSPVFKLGPFTSHHSV